MTLRIALGGLIFVVGGDGGGGGAYFRRFTVCGRYHRGKSVQYFFTAEQKGVKTQDFQKRRV